MKKLIFLGFIAIYLFSVNSVRAQIYTQLLTSYCGTVVNIDDNLETQSVNVKKVEYRFNLYDNGESLVGTFDSKKTKFQLEDFGVQIEFGATYCIRIQVIQNNEIYPEGDACCLEIAGEQFATLSNCGETVGINELISATPPQGINPSGYEFSIKESGISENPYIVYSNNKSFNFTDYEQAAFNTTYEVAVRMIVSGIITNFSEACLITTENPFTQLTSTDCGSTEVTVNQELSADVVAGVQSYEFLVTNNDLNFSASVTSIDNIFSLLEVGANLNSTTYNVQVRVVKFGITSEFGPVCQVSTQNVDLSYQAFSPTCFGECNGSASVVVSGGTAPYTYLWNDVGNSMTSEIYNLCSGNYNLTVTDVNGGISFGSVTINNPAALSASIIQIYNPGGLDLTVSGGVSPYAYLWSSGANNEDIYSIQNGTYSVTVTDANGCTTTQSYEARIPEISFGTMSGNAYENELSPDSWEWLRSVSSDATIYDRQIAVDSKGNVVSLLLFSGTVNIGTETLTSMGGNDILLIKYNSEGDVLWAQEAGSEDTEMPKSVFVDKNDNIYIAGGFSNTVTFGSESIVSVDAMDMFLTKYSPEGNVIWAKNLAWGLDSQRAFSILIDGDDILIAGLFKQEVYFREDFKFTTTAPSNWFVAKFHSDGSFVWANQIKTNNISCRIHNISKGVSGGYFYSGFFSGDIVTIDGVISSNGGYDVFLTKIDDQGNELWTRAGGGLGTDEWKSQAPAPDGGIFVAGVISNGSNISGHTIFCEGYRNDMIVAKYDGNGNLIWVNSKGGIGIDRALGIAVANNMIYLTGSFSGELNWGNSILNSGSDINQDVFLGTMSLNGDHLSAIQMDGTNNDEGSSIAITNNGSIYIAGFFTSSELTTATNTLLNIGGYSYFIAKYKYAYSIPVELNFAENNADISVDYSIIGGSATGNDVDYALSNGTIIIPAGETNATINIIIIDDLDEENDEDIQIQLSNPINATIGGIDEFIFTILDNDASVTAKSLTLTKENNEIYQLENSSVELKVYPSVIEKYQDINFEFSGLESEDDIQIFMIDALGRKVSSKTLHANSDGTISGNIENHGFINSGSYFIIGLSGNKTYSKKIIVK